MYIHIGAAVRFPFCIESLSLLAQGKGKLLEKKNLFQGKSAEPFENFQKRK